MSTYLKYMETIELPYKVIGSYSCEISESGYISVPTASGLYIYQVYPIKDNSSPSFSVKKYTASPSFFILSANVGLDINSFLEELPQSNFYEGVLSIEFSAKLDDGSSVEQKIIKSKWSPQIIDNYDCILATLSNTGSLEIMVKAFDSSYYEEFKSVYNLTEKYTEMCRDTWQDSSNMTPLEQYNELKYRVQETLPTVFTWSNKMDDVYCILTVAYACGDISFWKANGFKFKNLQQSEIISFMNVINANIRYICAMQWVTIGNIALLFIGNSEGQVSCLKISNLNKDQVIVTGELQIWLENDQIAVKDIKFLSYLNKNYVLFTKGSEIVILLFNEDGKNIDSYIFHAGNIAITGIEIIGENKLLITSLNGATKEVTIDCVNSKINIEWRHFYININWYIYQSLNLVSSLNKMLIIFLTGPCKTADTKDDKDSCNLVIFFNTTKNPLQILLNNQSNSFKNYWDCLELFRSQTLVDKQLSLKTINWEKHCDKLSLYKLKLLLWITKLSEIIYEQTENINLISKSFEDVYQIFNIKMSINRILHLLKLYEANNNLTIFQLHNIFIINSFLKQIVGEDLIAKLDLSESIITLLLSIILKANAIEYPSFPDCVHCGERLMGTSCFPPHFDTRCSVSFMQVSKYPNYKCMLCGNIVHNEIEKEVDSVICPFCDIPMCKRD